MRELTSPQGSLAVAVSALVLVLGFRLARPARPREWAAILAWAGALVGQVLGAQGLLGGPGLAPGAGLRVAGAAVLVAGLLLAGRPARARLRAARRGEPPPDAAGAPYDPVYAGLALVAVGQLLRGPSLGGAVAVLVAVVVNGWVARAPRGSATARA